MDSDAKELGHVRMAPEKPLGLPRAECDHAFLRWQQQREFGNVGERWSAALRQQAKAPETRMALAADHQMVVDRDAERLGRRLDLARHLYVFA